MKTIALILSFIYLLSGIGFAINIHYCQDDFSSISFSHDDNHKCCCCYSSDEEEGCCSSTELQVKAKEKEHITTNTIKINPKIKAIVITWNSLLRPTETEFNSDTLITTPPPLFKPPIWLKNSALIVYS